MKQEYKDTFIYKVCEVLDLSIKDLAMVMNKTHKTIENWRKDGNIPPFEKAYMQLLIDNKQLEKTIVSMQKHKVNLEYVVKSNTQGQANINCNATRLKLLTNYRIILEEI